MSLHRYEVAVLGALRSSGGMGLDRLVERASIGRDAVLWALESLSARGYVEVRRSDETEAELTPEGSAYAKSSLPESRLIARLEEGTVAIKGLSGEERLGFQWAKSKGLVSIKDGRIMLAEKGVAALERGLPEETVLKSLGSDASAYAKLERSNPGELSELARRGLIKLRKGRVVTGVSLTKKGEDAGGEGEEEGVGALSREAISGRTWEGKRFKGYDVNVPVERALPAMRHPLAQNIEEIKRAYISNGFAEISGPVIDSAFWVFDALFQPQDHPARDAQDTFYLEDVEKQEVENSRYVRMVRRAHTQGWRYKWDLETATEPVLRTHMTSVSAHYIYDILSAVDGRRYDLPLKLFSLGRVFRNESVDARHLADFYHTDGIVIGRGLTFANLFDTIIRLYSWLGTEIRFKPAYFPFVEPGVELYAFSKGIGEWIEIGGAGMIRREITGVKRRKATVLAWGVAVERLMMVRENGDLDSISELYNNSIGWLRKRKVM